MRLKLTQSSAWQSTLICSRSNPQRIVEFPVLELTRISVLIEYPEDESLPHLYERKPKHGNKTEWNPASEATG